MQMMHGTKLACARRVGSNAVEPHPRHAMEDFHGSTCGHHLHDAGGGTRDGLRGANDTGVQSGQTETQTGTYDVVTGSD